MIYEEIEKNITEKIQNFYYNISDDDKPNGHRFIAPNGWKVKSIYANGDFDLGSHVSIYNKDEIICDFMYFRDNANAIWSCMEPMVEELKKIGVPVRKAIATAEIIYATEIIEEKEKIKKT